MQTDHGRSAPLVMLWGQRGLFITRLPPGHSNCSRLPPPAHQAAILHCQHTFLSSRELLEDQLWCAPSCTEALPCATAAVLAPWALHQWRSPAICWTRWPPSTNVDPVLLPRVWLCRHSTAVQLLQHQVSSCFLQAPHGQPLLYQVSAVCSPVRLLRRRRVTVSHPCCSRALSL